MTAALEAVDLVVGQALGQRRELRVLSEEVVAVVAPVLRREGLQLAVDRSREGPGQRAVRVPREQPVPVGAPDQLDDTPSGPHEQGLEFIDDPAVSPHGPVEPLQVAVHDPDEVVEPLPGR